MKKPLNKKRPTISDVAGLANVSTATVSRALQNPGVVSEATRNAVFRAVAETGYRANTAARMLRQNRSGTVLVVLPDIGNPFFSEILSGVEDAATEAGYTILIGNTNGEAGRARDLLEYLRNGRADGALLMNGNIPMPHDELLGLPLVSVSEDIPGSGIPHVGTDNMQATADITAYLIEMGHRNIAHVAGPEANILSHYRKTGYISAMRAAGLERLISVFPGGFTLEAGKVAARSIMDAPRKPTAVVSSNDESAMGAISAFEEHGLQVPTDISVTGFDDIAFASVFSPSLSTVHQARKKMGRRAMKVLLKIISGEETNTENLTVQHSIISRNSAIPLRE